MAEPPFDSLLLVSFGGPEGRDDVIPFLENVLRGKNVPRERMLEVAEHYYHFDGISPINQQNRDLMEAIRVELKNRNIDLPLYWGNRNWDPLLPTRFANCRRKAIVELWHFSPASSAVTRVAGSIEKISRPLKAK